MDVANDESYTNQKVNNKGISISCYKHSLIRRWLSTITGLDWTTGLSLKLRACQYINTYNVFVQLINGAYSYAACPGIILCCH